MQTGARRRSRVRRRRPKTGIAVHDLDGRLIASFGADPGALWRACFLDGGARAITGSMLGTAVVWDLGCAEAPVLREHRATVTSLSLSQDPGNELVATASFDHAARMWRWREGSAGTTTYTVGPWGIGDTAAGCPDLVPFPAGTDWLGIRYNCEIGPGESNVQTFKGVRGVLTALASSSSSNAKALPVPRVEDAGRGVRESATLLEKR